MQFVLYIASIVGALALLMMMPKRRFNLSAVGAVLGAATLGGVWLAASHYAGSNAAPDAGFFGWIPRGSPEATALLYYYVFSLIAIGAAARVITHRRPVYSALWFIMVILASAGLFLTLAAEFMAFAMVIIYAGAILVTYMFVIMLATQSVDPDFKGKAGSEAEGDTADYDRVAREPVAAVAAGFLLLAVLLAVVFDTAAITRNATAAADSDAAIIETTLPNRTPTAIAAQVQQASAATPAAEATAAAEPERLTNAEWIGLDLFASHPLGLELAGVILTVSLIGAVVIARTRVPEEDAATSRAAPDVETGATVHSRHEPGPYEREAIGRVGGKIGGAGAATS